MTSRSQRDSRIHYTPKKVKDPIKKGSPGGPYTPGAKAATAKAKKAAKKAKKAIKKPVKKGR